MKNTIVFILICVCKLSSAQPGTPVFTQQMKDGQIQKIKEAAVHAWNGYMTYAKGFDDLKPLSKKGKNWYKHSMLMTPVDAYDTFVLLGLSKEAEEAKHMILHDLNFDVDNEVQVFEITIRQLGALLSAYEHTNEKIFLDLATDLGNRLMPAFNTPTGMPYRFVHLQTGKLRDSINNPAEIGTLMMEFGQLSEHTKDRKYFNAAKKAIMAVYERRSKIDMVGEQINVITGKWVSDQSHISGYIDSYYEYLYKSWLLFGDKDFKNAFDKHNKAIKKYLLVETDHGTFMQHVNMNTGERTATLYGALDAFYAGLCSYAGDEETAHKIQEANFYMWKKFKIEPEEFDFMKDSMTAAYYVLRPENFESIWYCNRMLRAKNYFIISTNMLTDILERCRTEEAFSSLKNVVTGERYDAMESFFFAETLKYLYLIFAPPNTVDLKKTVFNTEAHALKIYKH